MNHGRLNESRDGCECLRQEVKLRDSQEEDDAGVGHGVGQTQDAAAHDGVTEVEDGHSKGGFPFKLRRRRSTTSITRRTKGNI